MIPSIRRPDPDPRPADQVMDDNGILTTVSIAEDESVVLDDRLSNLALEVGVTRKYSVTMARRYAQLINARCDQIEKLRSSYFEQRSA